MERKDLIMGAKTSAERFPGFCRGMGIGGWLTNYKRFNVLPEKWKLPLTIGDFEHFESYITEKDVERIASFGMDHVRLGFDQIVVEEGAYRYRESIFSLIEGFVKECERRKLNVVLNLHKAIGNYCDIAEKVSLMEDGELRKRFVALWVEFERRFQDHPAVAFELMNEVRDVEPELWNTLAEETIREIRRRNPSRKIIVGGVRWNSPGALKDLRVFEDENVIYTFHTYSPFEFTHQRGVLQAAPLFYNREMEYPGDIVKYRQYRETIGAPVGDYAELERMDREYLRRELAPAFEFVQDHPDRILWCGEFGTIRHCRLVYRENWMNDVISLLLEHGIPYCVWNYLSTPNDGNRFSLVDDDRREIFSPRLLRILQGQVD